MPDKTELKKLQSADIEACDKNRAKFGAKFKKWLKIGVFALQGTNWYPEVLESKLESFLSDFCVII